MLRFLKSRSVGVLVVVSALVASFLAGMIVFDKGLPPYRYFLALKTYVRGDSTPDPTVLDTHYLTLRKDTFPIPGLESAGGLTIIDAPEGGHYVVVLSGRGDDPTVQLLDWQRDVRVLPSAIELPINNFEHVPAASDGRPINMSWIRYNDIEAVKVLGGFDLYVSYSHWDTAHECFTLKLDKTGSYDPDSVTGLKVVRSDWQTVFTSTPCIAPDGNTNHHPFAGHQAGGRMAVDYGRGILWLTVGDHEFDGTGGKIPVYPQDTTASYG